MINWIDEIDWIGWFRRQQFVEKNPPPLGRSEKPSNRIKRTDSKVTFLL